MSISNDQETSNSAFLEKPSVFEENRKICREFGLKECKDEHRNLQRFVSQAIIALLSKHGLKQRDGEPYTCSCPKGFLQDPHGWVDERGLRFIGWPEGLPKAAISVWPTRTLFAIAVLFIRDSIHLEELKEDEKEKKGPKRVFRKRLSQARTTKPPPRIQTPESEDEAEETPCPSSSRHKNANEELHEEEKEHSEAKATKRRRTRGSDAGDITTSPLSISRSFASTSTAVSRCIVTKSTPLAEVTLTTKPVSSSSSSVHSRTSKETSSEESSSTETSSSEEESDSDETASEAESIIESCGPSKNLNSKEANYDASCSPVISTTAERSSSLHTTPASKGCRTPLVSFKGMSHSLQLETPFQETLFDLPFGVEATDLTPTIVRHLLSPVQSEQTGTSESETESEEEEESSEDEVKEVGAKYTAKRKAEFSPQRGNKRGRVS
ncbi:hypothetical protein SCHPADRAFT_940266 [Schizopora paradoxa]|uniref:Uncharacterized protein n=1 Tax=Schizopora paradoxa TaxID=27342 RepID=A0A0H2S9R4_9AGAM|nr:hypothetical protein SCHPADRAFT_940266 [Schizopora paradoxa]